MRPMLKTPYRRVRIRPLGRNAEFETRLEFAVATLVVMLLALAVMVALTPTRAYGQIAPDAPRLISPHGSGGMGVHWLRNEAFPGDQGALLVTWAMPALPSGMRLRAGGGQGAGGASAVFGGIDYQVPLRRSARQWGFELDWQSGVGISAGDYSLVTLPVGLSGGLSWQSGTVWIAPFVTAGVAADLRLGDEAPGKEFVVDPTLEAGLDVAFDRERTVVLRAATIWGERQAVSLGFAVGVGVLRR